jgi:hypothetical protein
MKFWHGISESKENRPTRMRGANNFCRWVRKVARNSAQEQDTGVPHWYYDAGRDEYFPNLFSVDDA